MNIKIFVLLCIEPSKTLQKRDETVCQDLTHLSFYVLVLDEKVVQNLK